MWRKRKIIGLDVGDRRIGVAISDPLCKFAQPLATIVRNEQNLDWLKKIANENDVRTIVVGLPLTLKGERGPQAQKVLEFADRLKGWGFDVVMWDERLTTKMAEKMLVEAGVRRSDRQKASDRVAAVLILQSYLDSLVDDEKTYL